MYTGSRHLYTGFAIARLFVVVWNKLRRTVARHVTQFQDMLHDSKKPKRGNERRTRRVIVSNISWQIMNTAYLSRYSSDTFCLRGIETRGDLSNVRERPLLSLLL